jgi:hypothetical protein
MLVLFPKAGRSQYSGPSASKSLGAAPRPKGDASRQLQKREKAQVSMEQNFLSESKGNTEPSSSTGVHDSYSGLDTRASEL